MIATPRPRNLAFFHQVSSDEKNSLKAFPLLIWLESFHSFWTYFHFMCSKQWSKQMLLLLLFWSFRNNNNNRKKETPLNKCIYGVQHLGECWLRRSSLTKLLSFLAVISLENRSIWVWIATYNYLMKNIESVNPK